jgi:hypothetical protein
VKVVSWILLAVAAALVVGAMAYLRGTPHHRGDEIGSHGTKVVIVHVTP